MADLNPKPQDVTGKEPELRRTFKTKYAENIKNGIYDPRDLERFEKDDAYTRLFLRTLKSRGDVDKAVETVHDSLKFRKEITLSDLQESSFPAELTEKRAIYYQGQDIHGHPILYINVKENVAKGEQVHLLKQYIAWTFDQHQKKNPEQMCVVLMDMSGASTGNMSMDITKYIITCFTTYFPAFLAYMINYDMPMLLSATWSAISLFLSSEQKQKLLVLKKKDITKYIADEHLWPHMKA
jgi:hypothetical protein